MLLLEAGGKDDWIWIHVPVGYLYCIGNPRTDWCYRTEPDAGFNGRSILYARGKVLGGCSSINAMLYLRGQRRDYDEWARTPATGRGPGERAALLQELEDYLAARATCTRGRRVAGRAAAASWDMLEACARRGTGGHPAGRRLQRRRQRGRRVFEVNQRRGVRWSAAKAFLSR